MSSVLVKAIIDNSIIVSAVETRDVVNKAIKIHNLSPMASAVLGRSLTMACLMGKELKNKGDYLTATINGGGPVGIVTVCADAEGHVKGCVGNPNVEMRVADNGHLDVGWAVGTNGKITVIKDIGLKTPYVGTSNLVNGEIATDFAQYFVTSEQQPCGITLGVGLDKNFCKSAGGVWVQVMPNCDDKLLFDVETTMYAMDEMSYQFDGSNARQVIDRFFGKYNPVYTEEQVVSYRCDCKKSKINKIVKGLGYTEAKNIVDEVGKIEVCCHFCDKKYVYTLENVDKIFHK